MATHATQAVMGWRRRLARAKASIAVTNTGSNRVPTSSATDHDGSTFGPLSTAGRTFNGPPWRASSAVMARRAARPKPFSRNSVTARSAPGPRSPDADSRTAGRPWGTTSPCSPTVSGTARRVHCASEDGPASGSPVSSRRAVCTVFCSSIEEIPSALDHGTTWGPRSFVPAMSPSTSTASTGPPGWRANSRAPASPPEPPLVETSTSVRRSSRPL